MPPDTLTLAPFAERAYLDYAISVVKGRALPDLCDGQKPVQRRILYAMHVLGLYASSKPRKSAAVVGEVLGKWHPHGDQSVYDALVRMAQDFSLRYPLIDGQGNFGSRDGDGAAAMRYTEVRLTPVARLLLEEIDQGTVDFQANYDGSTQEPILLPARLPFVLLNGASGIAVGLATEIPAHHAGEVIQAAIAMVHHPTLSHSELMRYLPGPDFPGGGQIITLPAVLQEIYANGRGSIKVRARWTIEALAKGQWQMVITELPPNTSTQKVLQEIENITNPKVKLGKKSVSSEQLALKQATLALLEAVRDESARDVPVRLVLIPYAKNTDVSALVQHLLAHTSLEGNVSLNLVMIGRDGRPQQKTLLQILQEWIDFRLTTLKARTQYKLQKAQDRLHLLEGRQAILLHMDQVIHLIVESDDPKPALMQAFGLSAVQADDILEIRLRQLARLEILKIEKELAALGQERDDLRYLLGSAGAMKKHLIKEMEDDYQQVHDHRRTLIESAEKAVVKTCVADELVTVIVSEKGWVRFRYGHGHDPSQWVFKAGDQLYRSFDCRSVDFLLAWGSDGRVYSLAVANLPQGRGDGVPMTSLVDLAAGTYFQHFFAGASQTRLCFSTVKGYGFLSQVSNMISRVKTGKVWITLEEGDALLVPSIVQKNDNAIGCLVLERMEKGKKTRGIEKYSGQYRLLVFGLHECKYLAHGGRGVKWVVLDNTHFSAEQGLFICSFNAAGLVLSGLNAKGQTKQLTLSAQMLSSYIGLRGRKGKSITVPFRVHHMHAVGEIAQ